MPISPDENLATPRRAEGAGGPEPARPVRGSLFADGLVLPPPVALADAEVGRWLWQTIGWLAARHCFLYNTDHLDDRELYSVLFREVVPEELADEPLPPGGFSCADLAADGSAEAEEALMRYYADEETRESWGWPDLPPREEPPFDRDRFLPGPYGPDRLERRNGDG